jgi:hypothetical protein
MVEDDPLNKGVRRSFPLQDYVSLCREDYITRPPRYPKRVEFRRLF